MLCLSHDVHTIGNHDEYHTHILGKTQKQIAKVLALNDRVLLVEFLDFQQAMNDMCYILSKFVLGGFSLKVILRHTPI